MYFPVVGVLIRSRRSQSQRGPDFLDVLQVCRIVMSFMFCTNCVTTVVDSVEVREDSPESNRSGEVTHRTIPSTLGSPSRLRPFWRSPVPSLYCCHSEGDLRYPVSFCVPVGSGSLHSLLGEKVFSSVFLNHWYQLDGYL